MGQKSSSPRTASRGLGRHLGSTVPLQDPKHSLAVLGLRCLEGLSMAAWRLSILRVARSTTTTSVRPPIAPTARGEYTYTTEAVDEEVTVPAGTFRCVRIRRNTSIHFDYDFPGKTADAFYNVQKAWLCPGVGVVRADNYRVDGDQEIFVSQIMLESYFDPEA